MSHKSERKSAPAFEKIGGLRKMKISVAEWKPKSKKGSTILISARQTTLRLMPSVFRTYHGSIEFAADALSKAPRGAANGRASNSKIIVP